jgi:hypothetical protein
MAGMPVSPPSVVVMQCAGVSDHVAAARLTGISWPWPSPQSAGRPRHGGDRSRALDRCVLNFFASGHFGGLAFQAATSGSLRGTSGAREGACDFKDVFAIAWLVSDGAAQVAGNADWQEKRVPCCWPSVNGGTSGLEER